MSNSNKQKEYDLYRERHQKLQDMIKKPADKKPKTHKIYKVYNCKHIIFFVK